MQPLVHAVALALAVLLACPVASASHGEPQIPGGFTLTLDPDPVRGDEPFTVRFAAQEGGLTGGKLKVCYSENHEATLCLLPVEMHVADDGARLVASSAPVPPGHEFGVNLTVTLADGSILEYPGNGAAYVFFTARASEKPIPAAAAGAIAGVLLAVARFAPGRKSP